MRFLIYGIFLSGWISMWIWTYTCHIKKACCTGRFAIESPIELQPVEISAPIAFRVFESDPVTGISLPLFRDSLLAELKTGRLLEITGLFTEEEDAALGVARAHAVLELLAPQLDYERYELVAKAAFADAITVSDTDLLEAFEVDIMELDVIADSLSGAESR